MKKTILFLLISVVSLIVSSPAEAQSYIPPFVSYTPVFDVTQRNLRQVILDDGIYELTVECKSSTNSSSRYLLDVAIKNDTVTHIYFDDGGYIHSGYNSSGYSWSGGGIRWNVDYYGNITGGTAIIQVSYNNGRWQLFTIRF